jgi:cytochrome c biogenesis protein
MNDGTTVTIQRPNGNFEFSMRQLYATGLQVAKDPGVWTVYIGCFMMLIGLYIAFFLSHRRVWVYISENGEQSSVLISGTSNKNRYGFEKEFASLLDRFQKNENLNKI